MMNPYIITETSSGNKYYTVEDYMFNRRELILTGSVNPESMTGLINQLMYLDRQDDSKEITLYICSPGGEVRSGLALYDMICMARSPIRTVCIGTAASMGAILFLSGDRRVITPHSQIMIHDPSVRLGDVPSKALAVQETLDGLMKTREALARIISEKTGKSLKTVYSKTKGDCYFGAEEAVAFGLATEIMKEI